MTSTHNIVRLAALTRAIPLRWRSPKSRYHPGPTHIARDKRVYFWIKRLLDCTLSFTLLLCLIPVFLVVALAIELDSPGPVIFHQQRMGYDWRQRRLRPFICHKFRSMTHGCDESPHRTHVQHIIHTQVVAPHSEGATTLVKLAGDCRVTRVGHILRKASIDELPQLWNILKGEMSLVGPRPVPLYEVAGYAPQHLARLQATPGLTGLWQVKGRGRTTIDEMVALDVDYIHRQSLWLDLHILWLTIPVVLSMHGAE